METIKATFFQECEELLAELESGLLAVQGGDNAPETVNAVFRAVHSIKGGAGAFGLEALVHFAHVFETALDRLRAGALEQSPPVLKIMLRAADRLSDLVRAAHSGAPHEEARSQALMDELAGLRDAQTVGPSTARAPGLAHWMIRFRPLPSLYLRANDPAVLLRELERLGTLDAALEQADLPLLDDLDPEGAYLSWSLTLRTAASETDIREVFEFVEGDCDLEVVRLGAETAAPAGAGHEPDAAPSVQPAQPRLATAAGSAAPETPSPAVAATTTIRVDLDRVDRLINLVGELVINQAVLAQRVVEAGLARSSDVAGGLDDLEQLTREIQDSVMAIRAQPVKSVFQRMPRLVRETAAATGKQVRLVTEGESAEVDKTVIERLTDPITHMIRNAIDHGLERPAERIAAGKPAEGVVRLSAFHRSGRIVIEIADDGAGIDRARVREKAVEQGLIPAEAVLSEEETDNLLFMPGFSTASALSDISGRGVGMDVVRRGIQALGGRIAIASRPGEGSTFTLSLPLTLAVLDGMVVGVGGQTLVAPLTTVIETLQPKPHTVRSLGPNAMVVAVRDSFVPLIDVGVALGFRATAMDPCTGVALLVENDVGAHAALLVDVIHGQRQVVIKSLESNYQPVDGIAAATILGDGRVALILDIDAIIANRRRGPPGAEPDRPLLALAS